MIFTARFPVPPAPRLQAAPCKPVEAEAAIASPAALRYLAVAFALVSAVAGTVAVLPIA